ncbi:MULTISPECIES: hypothetical protein [unclassified Ruegeria]|uniref:hypothetical protein n=1 Tax=unclassified Ruegeria TaxID=2625375 RepID=UPI001490EF7F|nr:MULTISPECIES: hypothetical protein [unclassified Ruegeria]NOD87904.1 hypothetical protein [Ruegeria sp. HKCCD4318]NOE14274.1 hypothetical protein [Ruegeria sp. HKCCD4318-2]NOG08369.1 hypothetical protein [Ruegeria sp. HKCCD4315]
MPASVPVGMSQANFNAAKGTYREMMMTTARCETCGVIGNLSVSYLGDLDDADGFDPDHLICRCRTCIFKRRTEPIKVVMAHADVA